MFRSMYTAASGMTAQQMNLDNIANNLANSSTAGYSSSQVDRRKVGKLAVAIQVAFQELGVFPASSTAVSVDAKEPVPFNTVQAIENAERTTALGHIVPSPKGVLGASENGDLSSLRQELEDALAPEIQRNEIAVSVGPDGLVVSLREIGFFESGSAKIRATSLDTFRPDCMAARRTQVPVTHRRAHRQQADPQRAVRRQLGTLDRAGHRAGSASDHEIRIHPRSALGGRICRISSGHGQ